VEGARSIGMPTFDSNNGRLMEDGGGASISMCAYAMESAYPSFGLMSFPIWTGRT